MIVSKLVSGLGNQLFQYAVGRQLSLIRETSLKLDTAFFVNQELRKFKLNHYTIEAAIATPSEINSILDIYLNRSLHAKLYRRIERYVPKSYRYNFREETWWTFEPELLRKPGLKNMYIEGYWQHYKYFANLSPVILKELSLKHPLTGSLEYLADNIIKNSSSVSVHIRRGDYLSDPNAYNLMGVLPIEYYQKAISIMEAELINPCYYVFSDDLDWVRDKLKINGPLHFVDIEGGKLDNIELELMSRCSHNIIANSSFSWWGAFLNKNPNKIVIAPNKWVVPNDINDRIKLQFPSWIKI